MIAVPWESLPPDTLDSLLEEIVTRDGTDYGAVEKSTAHKRMRARQQLEAGLAVLVWDSRTSTASLLAREEAGRLGLV